MFFLKPDGTRVKERIIGTGNFGVVLEWGSYALKIPRVEDTADMAAQDRQEIEYRNDCNRFAFAIEKRVYSRVRHCGDGIATCIDISDDGILLAYYKRGTVEEYMEKQATEPERRQKAKWISSVLKAVHSLHDSKILIYDLAVRNLLIADDSQSLKMMDFGQCSVLADDDDIATANDGGLTAKVDLFHLGCVIYSIEAWRVYECDLLETGFELPPLNALPSVSGLVFGGIIEKCWTGQYQSTDQLCREASKILELLD
ncbi:hypothetical protein L228DRAFT_284744 [Xylona heveae TC161]|uniref:Protein kinase domain-containing protein n=1 Tax=Xylona heveae (strain CBS 132557 / TC161) TaxID=1328760 RepID=A0A165FCD4_XYLHT|nr:hypothetical protein L228DRAFT_284744 [Xylona heveae TC161]KZF20818.1 hypothetical protein L228DRAFT_284744 [Xylona heveae TC161]